MVNNELMEIRSNTIVMEALHDIAMDLPAAERSKYVQVATEAMATNTDTQLKIISKLAKQVNGLQQIDLEQCNKSMGDVTKYQYYDALAKAMEIINESEITSDIPNVIRMNKIHTILLDNREDFVWGYKKNEVLTMRAYCTLVRMLFIMIDLSISDYIKKMDINFKFNTKVDATPSKVSRFTTDTDRMIKLFESGEWRLLMNASKKAAANRTARAIDEMNGVEPPSNMANEAITINKNSGKPISIPTNPAEIIDMIKALPNTAKVILVILTIMLCYRTVAFYIAKLGAKFANVFRHSAELIKAYGEANRDQSSSAVERQNKMYNRMIGTADRIDAFFNKAAVQADAELKEANRKDLNTAEITTIDSIDFGF